MLPKPGGTIISAFAGTQGIWTSPNGHQHYVVTRICSPDLSALALNHARGVVGPLEGVLGASWGVLVRLGASWGRLGAVLGRLGAVSGRLWDGFSKGRIKKVDREIFRWCPETKFCWGRTQNQGRKHVPYSGLEFRTTNGDTNRRCRNVRVENTDRHAVGVSDPDGCSDMNATPTVGVAIFGPDLKPALWDVFTPVILCAPYQKPCSGRRLKISLWLFLCYLL